MRILFTTTLGAGHLTPLLPYARRLSARGHDVRFASRPELRDRLASEGYAHFAVDGPDEDEMEAIRARRQHLPATEASALNIREFFAGALARAARPAMEEVLGTWRPAVLVRESMEYAGLIAASTKNTPHARVLVHNAHWEAAFLLPKATSALDRLCRAAGLSCDIEAALNAEVAFSAFPEAVDGDVQRSGSTLVRVASEPDESMPAIKPPWLPSDGKPLVYMTFGTVVAGLGAAKYIFRTGVQAVRGLPVHVLLTTGSDAARDLIGPIPDNVTVESWVPQREILPHVVAMVCHGGSGTLLGGLAAGVPMIVAPLFADQMDNAERLEQANVGLAVPELTTGKLRAALERVLGEPRFAERARQIAEGMKHMTTVDEAADRILGLAT